MGRLFSLSVDEAPLGMAATIKDLQPSGNDPRRTSPIKIMLNFGSIISRTNSRNRENTQRIKTTMCQDQEADAERQESGRPKNYTETEGNKTKV